MDLLGTAFRAGVLQSVPGWMVGRTIEVVVVGEVVAVVAVVACWDVEGRDGLEDAGTDAAHAEGSGVAREGEGGGSMVAKGNGEDIAAREVVMGDG